MSKTTTHLTSVLLCALFASAAYGHVELDLPDGGEVLEVGSAYTIVWHVAIQHNLENWDLWYSTTGAGGPWIEIATDLPAGDPSQGSIHVYDWTVPDAVSEQVRVRVRQDNAGQDYYDVSASDLAITQACSADLDTDGVVNASDLAMMLGAWGTCAECAADQNEDGLVNAADLAQLLGAWGTCGAG